MSNDQKGNSCHSIGFPVSKGEAVANPRD